ncbi:hypothetical protein PENSPDRAFT_760418 [Peniophora sp. CONT]|nr:hypothetical protein PENSPDRAFT_760418 [Peniophora sp. CONT]
MSDAESLSPSPPAISLSEAANVCLRDTSSPPYIDRLPVELLCRAFCWLPHFDDEDNGVSLNSRTPPWIPVLHVSSFWRTITMECKELWSWIPLGHPEWTKMALRLSDPVAVALCIPGEHIFANLDESTSVAHHLMKETFTLVLEHLPRVWYLDLKMARPESSNVEDGEHYAAYVRARQMLAPLRSARMSQLISLRCARTDFLAESFSEESWASQVRDLWLVHQHFGDASGRV